MDATPDGVDASVDSADASLVGMDAIDAASIDGSPGPACTPNHAIRCDGDILVRCNGDGSAEVREDCQLGCEATDLRCKDVSPSNGLAQYLDMTAGEPDIDLATTISINTDDGTFMVDGHPLAVKSATVTQASAPTIRVFIVHSLTAGNIETTGTAAIAFVSNGDITIGGIFAASATSSNAGAGGLNDSICRGKDAVNGTVRGGCGGGGFGTDGARGGSATNDDGTSAGGLGGTATGNASLVPLRGGCDSGAFPPLAGRGGGAIQLVSRTKITIAGVVAANGSSYTGGGSGGGILLEAPVVEVPGGVVANGGAGGGGCAFPTPAENGRLDATPATGGPPCVFGARGGNGGAANSGAGIGVAADMTGHGAAAAFGGHGGGGVGRIRVNTKSGGLHATGIFSPSPTTETLATR